MAQPEGGNQHRAWRAKPGLRAPLGLCADTAGPWQGGRRWRESCHCQQVEQGGLEGPGREQGKLMAGQGGRAGSWCQCQAALRVQSPLGHSLGWRRLWQWGAGRQETPGSPGDTTDQALPLWLAQSVPAHVPSCPQPLQPGEGPGVAQGGPGQRNRRNNVPMRTSAFYFLPTTFSWQTRHSHDRGLGSKPRGQRDRHQRNAEVNTSTASGTPRQAPSPSPGRFWSTVPPGLPLPAPHSPEPLPHSGSAGTGGTAVSCLILAPHCSTSTPTRGDSACWKPPGAPCHLTTATGHNPL